MVEIAKLEGMVEMVEREFVENGKVCMPRRMGVRRSGVYLDN